MRFTVTFRAVKHGDLHHLLQSGIFGPATLTNINHYAKGMEPNPEMVSTVDFAGESNMKDLDTLNKQIHELPVCVFNRLSTIQLNEA